MICYMVKKFLVLLLAFVVIGSSNACGARSSEPIISSSGNTVDKSVEPTQNAIDNPQPSAGDVSVSEPSSYSGETSEMLKDALAMLPYWGNKNNCQIDAAMANAYAEVLESLPQCISESNIFSAEELATSRPRAILVDPAGDGVPLLMTAYTVYDLSTPQPQREIFAEGSTVETQLNLWTWNGDSVERAENLLGILGSGTSIRLSDWHGDANYSCSFVNYDDKTYLTIYGNSVLGDQICVVYEAEQGTVNLKTEIKVYTASVPSGSNMAQCFGTYHNPTDLPAPFVAPVEDNGEPALAPVDQLEAHGWQKSSDGTSYQLFLKDGSIVEEDAVDILEAAATTDFEISSGIPPVLFGDWRDAKVTAGALRQYADALDCIS